MTTVDAKNQKMDQEYPNTRTFVVDKTDFNFSFEPTLEEIRQMQATFSRDRDWDQFHKPRNLLLTLVGEVGELAEIFRWKDKVKFGLPDFTDKEREHVGQEMSDILLNLVRLADKCQIDLPSAVLKKIDHNGLKYPAHKVKGKIKKYTDYETEGSEEHIALKDGNEEKNGLELSILYRPTMTSANVNEAKRQKLQESAFVENSAESDFKFSSEPTLEKIRQIQAAFCRERDWDQFHKPRNLLLALVGEVGELAEIFQWKGEVDVGLPDFSDKEKEHVGQEMSDILIYLVRLADKCQIDLPSAVLKKIDHNGLKYPAHKVKGKNKKYTDYEAESSEEQIVLQDGSKGENGPVLS
ncbi:uncharacterized protein LOC125664837 [Ostrea edulis]|uniref:uncharacterized protein LOC125664837 n=1 Tax=Ostrea edulis TaxID=37623 RepID=UPI0024AEC798|nr:uncharacterized protein LOC125664837 [Ostrea edulis]